MENIIVMLVSLAIIAALFLLAKLMGRRTAIKKFMAANPACKKVRLTATGRHWGDTLQDSRASYFYLGGGWWLEFEHDTRLNYPK